MIITNKDKNKLNNMKYYFINLLTTLQTIKAPSWVLLALSILAPYSSIIHLVIAFVVIDFATGIWAALKTKTKIESKKLRYTAEKLACYLLLLVASILFEKYCFDFTVMSYTLTKLIGSFLVMTEFISLIENLNKISPNNIYIRLINFFKKKGNEILPEEKVAEIAPESKPEGFGLNPTFPPDKTM